MFILRATQNVGLSVVATDRKGNPASVQNPTWSSSDTAVATVSSSADGLSALVSAVGPLGECTITLVADADLGDGVSEVEGTFDLEVKAGDAAVFAISAGTPEEQAAPAPTPGPEPTPEPDPRSDGVDG